MEDYVRSRYGVKGDLSDISLADLQLICTVRSMPLDDMFGAIDQAESKLARNALHTEMVREYHRLND